MNYINSGQIYLLVRFNKDCGVMSCINHGKINGNYLRVSFSKECGQVDGYYLPVRFNKDCGQINGNLCVRFSKCGSFTLYKNCYCFCDNLKEAA